MPLCGTPTSPLPASPCAKHRAPRNNRGDSLWTWKLSLFLSSQLLSMRDSDGLLHAPSRDATRGHGPHGNDGGKRRDDSSSFPTRLRFPWPRVASRDGACSSPSESRIERSCELRKRESFHVQRESPRLLRGARCFAHGDAGRGEVGVPQSGIEMASGPQSGK